MTTEVSLLRLHILRATYLLIVVGLGLSIWPGIVNPPPGLGHMASVVRAFLGAVSLLALLGLRYPLRMLPLILFELTWKTVWVLAFGLPHWAAGTLDAGTSETLFACLMGLVIFPLAIPWQYVIETYLKAPAEPWRSAPRQT